MYACIYIYIHLHSMQYNIRNILKNNKKKMNKRLKTILSNDLTTSTIKIIPGTCLYALQDSSKHIWKSGSLIAIKSLSIIIFHILL